MIYELRIYRAMPGRLPDLLDRFRSRTLAIFERFGIRQVGFWTTVVGPSHLQLVYMLAWDSMADRDEKWEAFQADPEWRAVLRASEENGVLLANAENSFLRPTDFSDLQ